MLLLSPPTKTLKQALIEKGPHVVTRAIFVRKSVPASFAASGKTKILPSSMVSEHMVVVLYAGLAIKPCSESFMPMVQKVSNSISGNAPKKAGF